MTLTCPTRAITVPPKWDALLLCLQPQGNDKAIIIVKLTAGLALEAMESTQTLYLQPFPNHARAVSLGTGISILE